MVVCWCVKIEGFSRWKHYPNERQDGRRDFQIDLAISLLNIAVEWDWTGDERPQWMRQRSFLPCDCEQCYCCLKGHTTGVEHRGKKQKVLTVFANGARRRTNGCRDERVAIPNYGYCRMCYRQQSDDLSRTQKVKACRTSRKGCPVCKEPICQTCWGQGYDMHWVDA